MRLRTLKTCITRNDMAKIFELIQSGERMTNIAKKVGYQPDTVARGVVLAKLLGFEGVS
jgi:hypothetical protein